jgi:hypothetical protein
MSKSSDKLYVYLNHQKTVDQTVKQFFDEQGGGRTFSEFTKSIIYHYAIESGYQTKLSAAIAPPPPAQGKLTPTAIKRQAKKKHSAVQIDNDKHTTKKAEGFGANEDEADLDTLIPSADSMSDDIMIAVNSIM